MDYYKLFLLCLLLQLSLLNTVNGQLGIGIRDFVHLNIVGAPVLHDKTTWDFDPDVSLKRRNVWEKLNGRKGEKLIERLGLGVDGNLYDRLVKQRARDEGHLNGLNYYKP